MTFGIKGFIDNLKDDRDLATVVLKTRDGKVVKPGNDKLTEMDLDHPGTFDQYIPAGYLSINADVLEPEDSPFGQTITLIIQKDPNYVEPGNEETAESVQPNNVSPQAQVESAVPSSQQTVNNVQPNVDMQESLSGDASSVNEQSMPASEDINLELIDVTGATYRPLDRFVFDGDIDALFEDEGITILNKDRVRSALRNPQKGETIPLFAIEKKKLPTVEKTKNVYITKPDPELVEVPKQEKQVEPRAQESSDMETATATTNQSHVDQHGSTETEQSNTTKTIATQEKQATHQQASSMAFDEDDDGGEEII